MPALRVFFDGGETQNGKGPDRELQVLEVSRGCECDEGMILCSGGMSDRGITLREWCDPFFIVCE